MTFQRRSCAEVQGRQFVFPKAAGAAGRVRTELEGFGSTPTDYGIQVESGKTGTGARVASARPLANAVFRSAAKPVRPEAYIHAGVKPGQESKWRITYDY